jgi:hypothetical protein
MKDEEQRDEGVDDFMKHERARHGNPLTGSSF